MRTPSVLAGKHTTKVNRLRLQVSFLLLIDALSLIVSYYADNSELSYTTTLSNNTDTILPVLE